ncbi:sugar transferase [Lyngbya confervoides]|uniref:Sugar transferase n=1 Tax=Lyngbya confervoides BDU141951 TaxID=1574623 RepID=A0ABD4T447_9CYAN|nr:sugar transferase [Lyngbya confervoides]MCM1983287.1 sugar transferase [Lyngbya confervoides BDU141951]
MFPLPPPASQDDLRASRSLQLQHTSVQQWISFGGLALADLAALALAWHFAARLNQLYSPIPQQLIWWVWLGLPSLFWLFAGITLMLFTLGGLYNRARAWKDFVRAAQVVSLAYGVSLVASYIYDPKVDVPRSLFFSAWLFSIILIIGFRLVAMLLLQQFEQRQAPVNVFIIAPADRLVHLSKLLQQRSHYTIAGAALASTANTEVTLQRIVQSQAQEVIVENLPHTDLASHLYWQLRRYGISLRLIPSSVEILHRRGIPEIFAGMPTLRSAPPMLLGLDYRMKRAIDIIAASLGLLVLAPVFTGLAIAIKLTSTGPIFYRQERVGLHGRVFPMWKFRTMVANADQLQAQLEAHNESQDGILFKMKQDPRRTRLGSFLRRTSLDELPQLINVVCGQMSLVGPRPLPIRDVERFNSWHHIRHQVLPGITGLWQISGRSHIDSFDQAARLDLYYIDNWSLNLDFEILVETFRIVLFANGAY